MSKYLILIIIIGLTSCSNIDNYNFPDGTISGIVIDEVTNEGLQTEQPNGFNIRLFEIDGSENNPIVFSGKSDGSFKNEMIFKGRYKIVISEGAFPSTDTAIVDIGSTSEVTFNIIPYLSITDVSYKVIGNDVAVEYKIKSNYSTNELNVSKILISKNPNVNNSIYDQQIDKDISAIPNNEIDSLVFRDTIKNLSQGDFYFRIGARTDNPLRRYNYSSIEQINIP